MLQEKEIRLWFRYLPNALKWCNKLMLEDAAFTIYPGERSLATHDLDLELSDDA